MTNKDLSRFDNDELNIIILGEELTELAKEASEAAQAVFKIGRFGMS